jgi:hypothetical protein
MAHMSTYSYDKEADVLYISFAPDQKPTAAVELHENILLPFNLTEKRAVGLTLMDFSVLVHMTPPGPRSFPLSGLKDLAPAWRETVIEIITKPPVNQILRVSSYMPSMAEAIPITAVEKPPIPAPV